jgi:hypothetical protein
MGKASRHLRQLSIRSGIVPNLDLHEVPNSAEKMIDTEFSTIVRSSSLARLLRPILVLGTRNSPVSE